MFAHMCKSKHVPSLFKAWNLYYLPQKYNIQSL